MTDLNTGVTLELNSKNSGDAQMIQGAIAIRYAGVVASHSTQTMGTVDARVETPMIIPQQVDVSSLETGLKQQIREQEVVTDE